MPQVTTRLSEEQIEKIELKKTTVYKFLQEAVDEKLINDERKKEVKMDEGSTTELLLDLVQTVSERLKEINFSISNIDKELLRNNEIAKNKLGIIAEILEAKKWKRES